ncbi:acylphosphatase-2-like [Phycodurus eques]|uniref:acylphosphatase-2-like n=1 Tax=Phycodurus eques TaxID=693459 RepID=UPI002ACE005A|nr:acylphosphatase-2-like [Phycodurus eques]
MSTGSQLLSVDFEVFEHVQGVCFRMCDPDPRQSPIIYTHTRITKWQPSPQWKLFLFPSCRAFRKPWLGEAGSPASRITRTSFANERSLSALEMSGLGTRY